MRKLYLAIVAGITNVCKGAKEIHEEHVSDQQIVVEAHQPKPKQKAPQNKRGAGHTVGISDGLHVKPDPTGFSQESELSELTYNANGGARVAERRRHSVDSTATTEGAESGSSKSSVEHDDSQSAPATSGTSHFKMIS